MLIGRPDDRCATVVSEGRIRLLVIVLLALLLALAIFLLMRPAVVGAACHPIPITTFSPTGVAGCEVYGDGTASWWQGPGIARNDCLWPWETCQAIRITALDTGKSLTITPTMYCDCFTGTAQERIVDLDPAALVALGLDPALGLYPVMVELATMPNTAMRDVWPMAGLVALGIVVLALVGDRGKD